MSEVSIEAPGYAQQMASAPVSAAGHTFRWLATGTATFETMLRHVERARHSVALEFYICKPGGVSDRFRIALIAACLRGVHVQLLLDAFGSDEVAGGYWHELEQRGGQLRWFNPMRLLRLTFRNHRKLLVIDRATAIVGGLNLADEYDGDGVTHGWRDFALELQGPMVDALTGSFERMWALAAFEPSSLRNFARAHPRPDADVSGPALLLTGPGCRTVDLRRQLYADLRTASRVTVHAAYFLPSGELGRMLANVALRGEVRILMPANSDVPVAQLATWHAIRRLGSVAIRFFEYLPQMMHGKLLVIDDVVYVGSANLDVRSRLINYELMLRLPVPALAEQARGMFETDLRHSRPATMATPTWWQKLRQHGAYWLLARFDPYVTSRKLRMLQ
jgi:cardiolipin synthase A/B